jgi:hypothetical protein
MPTFKFFTPLLQAHSASIAAIPCETHSYGPHPTKRPTSTPPPPSTSETPRPSPGTFPILIFLCGCSLTGGERIPPAAAIPDSLVYANLGAFFASRGFVTLIPDYRRVEDTKAGTVENAVYASGAEDLASVLACVAGGGLKHLQSDEGLVGTVRVLGGIFS